jgi:hypothetical protein
MIPIPKYTRRTALIIAAVVAFLAVSVVSNAVTTLTVPNAFTFSYNLAAGANSGAIGLPTNRPVHVMGCCITDNFRGVGHVSVLVPSVPPQFIEWTGLESINPSVITSGFSPVAGTHILYLDFAHQVDLEVNTPTTMRVHNGAAAPRAGNITVIW